MAEQLELVAAPLPGLRPFWRYYGGKWRSAPLYPQPRHRRIVELFAGSAGYALRYPACEVVLVELFAPLAEIWRFLIAAEPHEIEAIPLVDAIVDLPAWVPAGGRALVRHCLGAGLARGINVASAGVRFNRERTDPSAGWSALQRARVAAQVPRIKHWRIIEGDYTAALPLLDRDTTSFWDPPYSSPAGAKYPCRPKGTPEVRAAWYTELGEHVRAAPGQVIACENEGATWLPFRRFGTFRRGMNGPGSREAIYYQLDGHEATP